MIVVLGDGQEPLTRDIPASRHVFQERQDIFPALGTTKTYDEDRIVAEFDLPRRVSANETGSPVELVAIKSYQARSSRSSMSACVQGRGLVR